MERGQAVRVCPRNPAGGQSGCGALRKFPGKELRPATLLFLRTAGVHRPRSYDRDAPGSPIRLDVPISAGSAELLLRRSGKFWLRDCGCSASALCSRSVVQEDVLEILWCYRRRLGHPASEAKENHGSSGPRTTRIFG